MLNESEIFKVAIEEVKEVEHNISGRKDFGKHQAELIRVHNEKVKNDDRKKKLYGQYMWTITKGRQEGEITDLLIHPKTKPVVVTMFINYDIKNFEYHKEFKFDDFDPREWDQMGPILRTKHNAMMLDKLNSLSKKYIRLQEIAKSLNIDDSIPLPLQDHSLPKPIQEKRKAMELEPEVYIADKSTANQKFVKLMDEIIAARPEKNNLLSKKAKWELMRIGPCLDSSEFYSQSYNVFGEKMRMKLCKEKTTVAKEYYSSLVQQKETEKDLHMDDMHLFEDKNCILLKSKEYAFEVT
ncbi:hypothetical protein Tco_0471711 [Tanacetum coccineum]